jgi:hypothetical protein
MAEPVLQSLPLEGLQSGDNRAVIGVTILTIAGRCCVRGKQLRSQIASRLLSTTQAQAALSAHRHSRPAFLRGRRAFHAFPRVRACELYRARR